MMKTSEPIKSIETPNQRVEARVKDLADTLGQKHGLNRRRFLARVAGMAAAFGAIKVFGSLFMPSSAAAQVQRKPGGAEPILREPVWLRASIADGHVTCKGKGSTCAVFRLVNAKTLSSFHDAELEKCTTQINAIAKEIADRNKDPKRRPCFIVTPYAPFLAWAIYEAPDRTAERGTPEKEITLENDPTKFYQALGISRALESYREKPTRNWTLNGGRAYCRKGGDTQTVGRLLNAERLSPIHDAELQARTNQVNAILSEYEKRKKNPRHQLSLLVTPKGLFLAWSEDDDREGPLPQGAITAADDEAKVLQALGI